MTFKLNFQNKKIMPAVCALILLGGALYLPGQSLAHQPRIPDSAETIVTDPEISKAYYSQMAGDPHVYRINIDRPFDLYVNVLVPDIEGQKKDVSAAVLRNSEQVAILEGINFKWEKFYEPFGRDTYWKGPEFKTRAEPGNYEIIVWSSNNDSKYALAIGEKENFNFQETANALRLVPQIKRNFFNESPAGFIFSPLGAGYVFIMFLFAFIAGFILRALIKRSAQSPEFKANKNLGPAGRILRALIGTALLAWAITTAWNPFLLFLSGFMFFEAIFSWCPLKPLILKFK